MTSSTWIVLSSLVLNFDSIPAVHFPSHQVSLPQALAYPLAVLRSIPSPDSAEEKTGSCASPDALCPGQPSRLRRYAITLALNLVKRRVGSRISEGVWDAVSPSHLDRRPLAHCTLAAASLAAPARLVPERMSIPDPGSIQRNARADFLLVDQQLLSKDPNDPSRWTLQTCAIAKKLRPGFESYVCESEPCAAALAAGPCEEPAVPRRRTCSGFLFNENTLLTAGHCICDRPGDIQDLRFLSGFEFKEDGTPTTSFDEKHIFRGEIYPDPEQGCRPGKSGQSEEDWAVIRLHNLQGQEPVDLSERLPVGYAGEPNTDGQPSPLREGERLYMIGHPLALPALCHLNGQITGELNQSTFLHDLDMLNVNSGSMVVRESDHRIEGIAIEKSGADFRLGSCLQYQTCTSRNDNNSKENSPTCQGNKVTRLSHPPLAKILQIVRLEQRSFVSRSN